jgi:hypothetical protein
VAEQHTTGGAARALGGLAATALRPAAGALSLSRAVAEETVTRTVDAVLASGLVEHAVDQALAEGVGDRVAARVLESGLVEHAVDRALTDGVADRVVVRVLESGLIDEVVTRLLASDELWLMVDEIASSEAVTEAIGRQSIGFADQVAGVVRDRSANVDDRLERVARRLLRRRPS